MYDRAVVVRVGIIGRRLVGWSAGPGIAEA